MRHLEKCTDTRPCRSCANSGENCVFNEELDHRRKLAQKRKLDDAEHHRSLLEGILKIMRSGDESLQQLVSLVRSNASFREITACIDDSLAQMATKGLRGNNTAEQLGKA